MSWEVAAAEDRMRRRQRERLEVAWVTAALTRTKQFPDLKKFLREPARKQTWQEMKAALMAIAKQTDPS